MYSWYKKSGVCYAYLADVSEINSFSSSRWFTRGWTLQETIAPDYLEFYSKNWELLGTKRSLHRSISVITGIPEAVLYGERHDNYPVAQKMSWAANRTTTKPEDMAYCLMGIFHVNMPMLYGEGGYEAFYRLQRGIMEITEDHTLFTWQRLDDAPVNLGFLANSPRAFTPSLNFRPEDLLLVHPAETGGESEPPTSTGRGLRIQLPLLPSSEEPNTEDIESTHLAFLNVKHGPTGQRVFIYLEKERGHPNYRRTNRSFGIMHFENRLAVQLSTIYINHVHPDLWGNDPMIAMASHLVISVNSDSVDIRDCLLYEYGERATDSNGFLVVKRPEPLGQNIWSLPMSVSPGIGTSVMLLFVLSDKGNQDLTQFSAIVGFNGSYLPWCSICTNPETEERSPGVRTLVGSSRPNTPGLFSRATSLTAVGYVDCIRTDLSSGHDLLAVVRRRLPLSGDRPILKAQDMTDSGRQFYIYTLSLTLTEQSVSEPDSPQVTAGASTPLSLSSPTIQRSMTDDLAGMGFSWE